MSGEGPGGDRADGRPLIVIVDPNHDFRTILEVLLEHEGFESASTTDPDEALQWAMARRPDAIIGEHPMPLSDGRILCAALLEAPDATSIPFIAVTARAFPEDLKIARETHLHGVLTKPIDPQRIIEHVRAIVGGADS